MLEYRGLSKLKSTYTGVVAERDRAEYGAGAAQLRASGRSDWTLVLERTQFAKHPCAHTELKAQKSALSLSRPKAAYRWMFTDYSQIELCILAHLSQDPGLPDAFRDGDDVHARTAAQIFGVELKDAFRLTSGRMAKVINFGLILAHEWSGLANNLGISRTAAQQYMDQYFIQCTIRAAIHGNHQTVRARAWLCADAFWPPPVSARYSQSQRRQTPRRRTRRDQLRRCRVRLPI